MRIISRQTAKTQGLKRYFTGKPCLNGHIGPRSVANKHCLQCARERQVYWREVHPIKAERQMEDYIASNPESWRKRSKDWRDKNPDKVAAKNAEFRASDPTYAREWQRANVKKCNLYTRRWRARKNGWPLEPLP
jgi:hypothetical protein